MSVPHSECSKTRHVCMHAQDSMTQKNAQARKPGYFDCTMAPEALTLPVCTTKGKKQMGKSFSGQKCTRYSGLIWSMTALMCSVASACSMAMAVLLVSERQDSLISHPHQHTKTFIIVDSKLILLLPRPTHQVGLLEWTMHKQMQNRQIMLLTRFSTRTTPLSTASVSVSSVLLYTTPGQSMRKMRFISVMYCHTFVSPGIGATLHTCTCK